MKLLCGDIELRGVQNVPISSAPEAQLQTPVLSAALGGAASPGFCTEAQYISV